jgi:pimeloyl-ACP methyl ester carboxylesterase
MSTVRGSTAMVEAEPPVSRFMTVEGIRLRYVDRGSGTPVLLLHGNGSMVEDFVASGIMDNAPGHRFIAFDRPGFGHSERPAGRSWGPFEQASLLLRALAHLEIERPIIVGHSWGALVALAIALQSAEHVAGLVLMSGYYYPMPRAEAIRVPAAAFPFVRRLMAPDTIRRVFAPCTVPERFKKTYPMPLAMRASQMRTVDEEAAMLLGAAKALCQLYRELSIPVHLIAGSEDRIVDTDQHSLRLHLDIGTSTFTRLPGVGHMVHHAASKEVLEAIVAVGAHRSGKGGQQPPEPDAEDRRPAREWLHIGGDLVAA